MALFKEIFTLFLFLSHALGLVHDSRQVSVACAQSCQELAETFGDRLHYYGNDSFIIWDVKQLEVEYACRVEPGSTEEVAAVLKTVVDNSCNFAVKGGGHSRFPNDSNSVGGVTIDLDLLNSIELSEDQTTVTVGGGANHLQIYQALDPYGLAHIGGRVGSVGLGGYTLGGGTSILSAKYGWALDNVYEYEVVLANSTIVTASETQNPDLYFALRGGGSNFGIVTHFTLAVYQQGPIFTGSRTYNKDYNQTLLQEFYNVFDEEDVDGEVGLEYTYAYNQTSDDYQFSVVQRYSANVSQTNVFSAMDRIPALTSSDYNGNISGSLPSNYPLGVTRNVFATITHFPSLELTNRALAIYQAGVQPVKNVTSLNARWITYSIPAAAIQAMKLRGGNALGIDVEGHLLINLLTMGWTEAADDERMYAFADYFITEFQQAAVELGASHPYLYMNYANKGQDIFGGYGQDIKDRLTFIQKDVDPNGVFRSTGLWTGYIKLL
ncbi:hypothetical protein PFICI_09989 [Pestalotiopsis fici W106-1]|uniref:FAD-binding PCMH-type domain-containing protein n=1 Tax=Pestalotiopsis fici (strain W106-1 / CGMCC3.15140) TaxID=1229662 RepID=W3WXR7_PESFW|nr:uncharacterized protein PFICI_09989 [Pestalotiopsis fici W106-1]ETS77927.1 hypothetical protein PFICI_09989 [Pestalotiopsis fici W106-1]